MVFHLNFVNFETETTNVASIPTSLCVACHGTHVVSFIPFWWALHCPIVIGVISYDEIAVFKQGHYVPQTFALFMVLHNVVSHVL